MKRGVVILFVFYMLIAGVRSQENEYSQKLFTPEMFPEGGAFQVLNDENIHKLLTGNNEKIIGPESGTIEKVNVDTKITSFAGIVTGFEGSKVIKSGTALLEGKITSKLPENAIAFYSLVDESIVNFDVDKEQSITVEQFKDAQYQGVFKATLSKGVKVQQFFKGKNIQVTFEATQDNAQWMRSGKSYECEQGIFSFSNGIIEETGVTEQKMEVVLEGEQGIENLRLPPGAQYIWKARETAGANIGIKNTDTQEVTMVLKKKEQNLTTENGIDFLEGKLRAKGKLQLSKRMPEERVFYESFQPQNQVNAVFDLSFTAIKSLHLDTQGQGEIATIQNTYYNIKESKNPTYRRTVTFTGIPGPQIEEYTTTLDPFQETTLDQKQRLIQKNKYTFVALPTLAATTCKEMVGSFMEYVDETFNRVC